MLVRHINTCMFYILCDTSVFPLNSSKVPALDFHMGGGFVPKVHQGVYLVDTRHEIQFLHFLISMHNLI